MSNFKIVDDLEHGIPMTDENMAQFGWVKVVRCRDCRFYDERHRECPMLECRECFYKLQDVEPDCFCSWGERRES